MIIPQFYSEQSFREKNHEGFIVSMNTDDYKSVIDEICASEIVYTSSLHGIILAESYGIPAVFFRGLDKAVDFKRNKGEVHWKDIRVSQRPEGWSARMRSTDVRLTWTAS